MAIINIATIPATPIKILMILVSSIGTHLSVATFVTCVGLAGFGFTVNKQSPQSLNFIGIQN